jgi:hypothetical protein
MPHSNLFHPIQFQEKTMTTTKSIVLSAFGLVSTCFLAMPAFAGNAGSVTQITTQENAQVGINNMSVQGSDSTAFIEQSGAFPGAGGINGGSIFQGTVQHNGQVGINNQNVQGASSHGTVYQALPGFPDLNAGQIKQMTGQTSAQLGDYNQNVQGANAVSELFQF